MSRSIFRLPLVVMVGAALGACGDSTGPETTLTEEEAAALASVIVQAALVASLDVQGGAAPVSGPQAAPFAYEGEVSFSAECPLGGGVAVAGFVSVEGDDETDEGRIELSVTHEHDGCVVEAENGMLFTLDGSPRIEFGLVFEHDGQGQLDWAGSLAGGVDWATEEREGRCAIALEFFGSASDLANSISASVEGVVCQTAVDHSWSLVVGTD